MKYFSVPADFKKESIDRLHELNLTFQNSRVLETYGSISRGEFLECGRVKSQLPEVDILELADYADYAKQKNIDFNYTLNSPYMHNLEYTSNGILKLKSFLHKLYQYGIRSLTVTLSSLVSLIKSTGLDFRIKASTICSINNANKAMALKKIGFDRMVVDQSITRDFFTLKRIRDRFGENVEIIANTPCYRDCASRLFHYLQISGDSIGETNDVSLNFYEHMCMARRYADVSNWMKINWIRPEDLKYYMDIGIHYFKLQGRQTIKKGADIIRALKCYFTEDYDGNLIDLINLFAPMNPFEIFLDNKKLAGFIKPFFEKDHFCIHDCPACNYCEKFARRCMDITQVEEVNCLANQFYHQYDQYNKMLKEIPTKEILLLQNKLEKEGDFGF